MDIFDVNGFNNKDPNNNGKITASSVDSIGGTDDLDDLDDLDDFDNINNNNNNNNNNITNNNENNKSNDNDDEMDLHGYSCDVIAACGEYYLLNNEALKRDTELHLLAICGINWPRNNPDSVGSQIRESLKKEFRNHLFEINGLTLKKMVQMIY